MRRFAGAGLSELLPVRRYAFFLSTRHSLWRGIVTSHENAYWLFQKDYENFAVEACEIEGITFYYPVQGDQTGYDAFPSAPAKPRITFLGTGLADGFRGAE